LDFRIVTIDSIFLLAEIGDFDTLAAFFLPVTEQLKNLPMHFWRIYEMDFPERPYLKAPGGFRFLVWSCSPEVNHVSETLGK
jgi:hypothetical protein